jgi:two-component system chemotaxis sensor kinase CheA
MVGEDTDLDKNLVEALADPLIHLVRNSVDHGIEMPDVRAGKGKQKKGTITLSAKQEGENILLSIEDDGAGIDPDVIKRIAIDKGVIDPDSAARLTDEESYNLIFMPGFSTKEAISDISGRGVGMDVVKTKITQLNGTLRIASEIDKGSVIEIKVPLTLAIMPTLMVKISEQVYALPLTSVVEIFNFDESAKRIVDGQEVLLIRDHALPIYHLDRWLSNNSNDYDNKRVVVVNSAGKEFGFVVDSLLGQEEVVIKPLGALLHGTQGMSGATITGDGKISLILDVPGLMQTYASGL